MTSRLITIPFSHFCEKARWALDRCAVPFEEDAHLPPFHFGATSLAGSRSTPLLVVDGGPTLTDSTDILEWADGQDPQGGTLFAIPEARELEAYFDDVLGIHARRVSYGALLDDPRAFGTLMTVASVPELERRLAAVSLPLLNLLLRQALGVSSQAVDASRRRVAEVFAGVEARLADGRRYLCGDRFSAADLTFAALAAPLVVPPQYEQRFVALSSVGSALRSEVDGWRDTRAGAFALDLYRENRDR